MRKKERHRLITRLLSEQDIQKQEEFVELLQEKGCRSHKRQFPAISKK